MKENPQFDQEGAKELDTVDVFPTGFLSLTENDTGNDNPEKVQKLATEALTQTRTLLDTLTRARETIQRLLL